MSVHTFLDVSDAVITALETGGTLEAAGLLGGVHYGVAPPGTTRPWLKIWQTSDPVDVQTIGVLCYTEWQYGVAVVTEDAETAAAVYQAAHTLLERTAITVPNGTHDTTYRMRPFGLEEPTDAGTIIYHVGGIYAIGVRHP